MDKKELVDMLNQDLADEHASILRYLIHAYQVGEATPFGSMLLSTAREEMWHMNWLGDAIGELGAEPRMEKGDYPYDPTSNASILRSYMEWEERLVQLYAEQAKQVEDPEISRMLLQEGLESETHRKRFEEWLDKLGPEAEEPFEYGEEPGFSPEMLARFQGEITDHYQLVLQELRHAFVFEGQICPVGSGIELSAMRHMKHMSHFAEGLAESGREPEFDYPGVDQSRDVMAALVSDLELTEAARERFAKLNQDPELVDHQALKTEVENMITRNELLALTVKELMEEAEAAEIEDAPVAPEAEPVKTTGVETDDDTGRFTVGSLIEK
ncbi:MAG TPA: ferritin-like domain-containing protein [Anaerolineae bacterium]|nr:ferritin-like domain-containing protein [Anaerolineae bacterium]